MYVAATTSAQYVISAPARVARTRPRAQRPASAAVAGNGVPSSRAIVRSSGVLHLGRDRRVELAQPGALLVAAGPLHDGLAQVVQLHAAVVRPGPHVEQALAELGVPHQRRHVVEHHRHPDVVDRRVGDHPDSVVGSRAAAEQPQVAGAGQVDRVVQAELLLSASRESSVKVSRMKLWKAARLAGLAGVAATGVIIARDQRARAQLTPDEVRERLHQRLADADAEAETPEP